MAGAGDGRASIQNYLRLPEEVLIATLQSHQRYFPMRAQRRRTDAGTFIAISNLESSQIPTGAQGQ